MHLLKKILNNSFAKNVAILAGGTAIGQIIIVAATPFLTRLYSPEDFGLLAAYAAILGIVSVIASLRYELAIPIPESDEEAASVFVLSIIILWVISALSTLPIFFFAEEIGSWLNLPKLSKYLWLIPAGIFFLGLYKICNYWAIRKKIFKAIAKTKVNQAISMIGLQLATFKLGALGLILGHAVGQSAGFATLGYYAVKQSWVIISKVNSRDIIQAAIKHKGFPIYSTWAGLLNSIGGQAPALLFAILFTPASAGLYFVAQRVIGAPMGLLGSAIGQAFFSEAAEAHRAGKLYELSFKTMIKLLKIIVVPVVIVMIFGQELFTLILGAEWREAGEMAQWLSLMAASQFITSPISQILAINNKQNINAYLQALLTILKITSIFIGYYLESYMISIISLSILSSAGYIIFLYFSLKLSK